MTSNCIINTIKNKCCNFRPCVLRFFISQNPEFTNQRGHPIERDKKHN